MDRAKIAISMNRKVLRKLDSLVKRRKFRNRSEALQIALIEKLARLDDARLARECAKLDVKEERAMAEERYKADVEWPEY